MDRWIVGALLSVTHGTGSPGLLVLVMALFVVVVRRILPRIAAQLLLTSLLSPWLAHSGYPSGLRGS